MSTSCFNDENDIAKVITAANFDKYFFLNTGICNCGHGACNNKHYDLCPYGEENCDSSGCPSTNAVEYIPQDGVIQWKDGKSISFQTQKPILTSGQGFVGFRLKSVPGMNENGDPTSSDTNIWNSIWLMGVDQQNQCDGDSCLEIDIYEDMRCGCDWNWWNSPKMSIHDWAQGQSGPASGDGCFGMYLNGQVEETPTCKGKNIITKASKMWPMGWDNAKTKVYKNASWYTLITGTKPNVKVYIGVSLDGWLPSGPSEATVDAVKEKSDFLMESPDGSITGGSKGGFKFSLTSTSTNNTVPTENTDWNIPCISVIDTGNLPKEEDHSKPDMPHLPEHMPHFGRKHPHNTSKPPPPPLPSPPAPPPSPSNQDTTDDPSCSSYPQCSHLAGDCCPTTSGIYLGCCQRPHQSIENYTPEDGDVKNGAVRFCISFPMLLVLMILISCIVIGTMNKK